MKDKQFYWSSGSHSKPSGHGLKVQLLEAINHQATNAILSACCLSLHNIRVGSMMPLSHCAVKKHIPDG
jgi:hypothetical protein